MDAFGPKVGDYIVEEELGRGASSILLRARHDVLDEVVALKVLRESRYIESLRREAKILHKIKHPSIIKLQAVSLQTDPAFLALELVKGQSLQERLEGGNLLEVDEALRIALAVLSALEELHSLHLVHGDIKPANILLGEDKSVKLIDFGFSYNIAEDDQLELSADLAEFQTKKRWGTFAYAAPELIKGEDLDGRTDLYSLGVVIFEMLTGQRPEPGDKPSDLRSELPAFLDELFIQCYCR
ncbi:MAG: serine/threonine-protein kinase, partial [Planctomycetota bacterium]|nr:serine/threonine-protein kinase [Planctomycetota bacterium]